MLDKRALRREIAAQKRALSPAQIEAASADLTAQLLAHPLFRAARSLYAYLSYNQEVRTLPLIRQAQALGKRAHPVPRPEELCPYPRGPCQGRAHGPDRLWPEVPHPAAPRRGRKGAAPGAEAARTKAPCAEAGEARRKETCGKAAQGAACRKGAAQSGAWGGVRQADGRPAPAGGALSEDPKEKAGCQKTNQAKSFRGKRSVKGNRQGVLSRLIASRGGTF